MELIERKQILNSDAGIKPLYQREFDEEENIYSSGLMTRKRIVNSNKFEGGKDPYGIVGDGLNSTYSNSLNTAVNNAMDNWRNSMKPVVEHAPYQQAPNGYYRSEGTPSISVATKNIANDNIWTIPSFLSMFRTPNIQIPTSNKEGSGNNSPKSGGSNWGQGLTSALGSAAQTANTWISTHALVKDADEYLLSGGYTTKYNDGVGYTAYVGPDRDAETSKINRSGAVGVATETASGASTGMTIGGPWGAALGALIGLGSGIANWATAYNDADYLLRFADSLKKSRNDYASVQAGALAKLIKLNNRYVNPNSGILYARRGKDVKYRV